MKHLLCAAAFAAIVGAIGGAHALPYPAHSITLIVPEAGGGQADALARILAPSMARSLGQSIWIENINGTVPSRIGRLARAAPDGYTFGISNRNYDPTNFRPIALLPSVPAWIVSRNTLPANNLKELISWMRANSDQARSGTLGFGTPGRASGGFVDSEGPAHICELLVQKVTGSRLQLVPYYSTASMYRGLLTGYIDFACDRATNTAAMVRGGLFRAHAVMAKSRWFAMPNIPTADERGLTEIYVSFWHGFWAPKGTSDDAVAKLNAAAVEAMADPEVGRRIADLGMEIPPPDAWSPEALGAFQRAEMATYCEAMLTIKIAIIPTCSARRAGLN